VLHVIIPTYESEDRLRRLLPQLEGERIIVADGGSKDKTIAIALSYGAALAVGVNGRGSQLRAGASLAKLSGSPEDWYLFLHSDSILPENWRGIVDRAMQRNLPRFFHLRADAKGWRARLLEKLVAFRVWGWGLPYGDQGLLISRKRYEAVGGYKPWPLFEDVDMVDRLPDLTALPAKLGTDVSKYMRGGMWKRGRRNLALLKRFRAGEDPKDLVRDYV
jgi:glycosyltransferase involved in cell wall biosynthesis